MALFDATPFVRLYARRRLAQLERLNPAEAQTRTLLSLVRRARDTRFGRDHGFASIRSVADFQARVPVRSYERMWTDYFQPHFPVLENVSWPGRIPFFAVSSGTTSGKTKYVPLTPDMRRSNVRAALDTLSFHARARPKSRFFGGKTFMLGGSTDLVEEAPGVFSGDLSGIASKTMPAWAKPYAFPPDSLTYLTDWEEKVARIAHAALDADIRALSGTPSWVLILLDHLRRLRSARGEPEGARLLPHLGLFVHGGVNFAPYRARFLELFSGQDVDFREVYPASEGFIANADRDYGEGLRLSLDNGLFFEFIPVEELGQSQPARHWAGTLETGVNYAVVMSTCAGLFAYQIGDTVRFVDRTPPRLLITGRTSYMLSAFGEHVIGEEMDAAVLAGANRIGARVTDYSAGAVFPKDESDLGGHLIIVEFEGAPPGPAEADAFCAAVDETLSERNDDYRAHRAGGFGLKAPALRAVPAGTFAAWMKSRGRLGGQNKVPRLIADQALFDSLRAFTGLT